MPKRRNRILLAGLAAVLAIAAAVVLLLGFRPESSEKREPVFTTRRGPLTISVTESGTVNYREKVILKSEVEGKTTILFLVDEGDRAEKGDLLIQLDASRLEEEKTQQQITVLNAEAAYVRARENLAVAQSQAESDIAQAELDYRFAQADQKKYLEGEYPEERQKAEADIAIVKEEFERAKDKLQWSQKLEAEGYINRSELQADELAARRKQIEVQLAEGKLQLLTDFTHPRALEEIESRIAQTHMALERVKRKATADTVQAEADLKAKASELEQQKAKLGKVTEQIAKCRIISPVAGVVVYATTGQMRWRGNEEPIQEGQEVHEGLELIHLPITETMVAEVKVHESSLMKVRKGLPVRIKVDALPGRTFTGTITKIGLLPDPVSVWLNPDLKLYSTEVDLTGDTGELRPGMTCQAEIVVEQIPEAVYVPVQSVVRVQGTPVVFVMGPSGPEQREVALGMDNNRMIHITSGLAEGEPVLLAPPLATAEAPQQAREDGQGADRPKRRAGADARAEDGS